MTEDVLYSCLQDIFAIFCRREPARHSAIVQVLINDESVKEIPDGVRDYVISRFKQLDTMPANLVKAFRGAWETYQLENPASIYREACQTCSGNGGWEAWEPDEDGSMHHFFAPCPKCGPRKGGRVYPHPSALLQRGCLVMPSGYKGGRLQFEADHGLSPLGTGKVSRDFAALRKRTGWGTVPHAASEDQGSRTREAGTP